MASEDHVQPLFKKLRDLGKEGEYENALKVSEEILKSIPEDLDALHCKAVCLVHCGRFSPALKLLDRLVKLRQESANTFGMMRAYCMYRLGKYKECLEVLKALEETSNVEGVLELKAQALYRLEEYRESSKTYERLIKDVKDDLVEERKANLLASDALRVQRDEIVEEVKVSQLTTYEQNFNSSLIASGRGRMAHAVDLLSTAEKMCRDICEEEGYEEDEIEEELNILRIQMAYLKQVTGKTTEATELYLSCVKRNPDDATQVAIASNNILVLNGERDIFDSKKRVRVLSNEASLEKLTAFQKQTIYFNQLLYALMMGQSSVAKEWLDKVRKGNREGQGDFPVLGEVALLIKQNQPGQAADKLSSYIASNPSASAPVFFSLAQLQIGRSSDVALKTLLSYPNLFAHLGVVTYLVAYYTRQNNAEAACSLWTRAVSFHEERRTKRHGASGDEESTRALKMVLMPAATFMLENGYPKEAVECLEKLRQVDPSNPQILIKLVSAYSKFDPGKAEDISFNLPTPKEVGQLDIDTLEHMPMYKHVHRTAKPATQTDTKVAPASVEAAAKKRKKKRKVHLPKNYNPSVSPDPERWLPLRERSYFKRGKKKAAQALRGTQGTVGSLSTALTDKLDASKHTADDKKGAAEKPADTKSPKPKSLPKSQPKKKGKKKGKGW